MNTHWVKRRWFDFRLGHATYLIFILSFSNFILIFHRLFLEQLGFELSLGSFIVIFVIAYFPLAIGIGAWHRKSQIQVETLQSLKQNPMMAKNFRILIDIMQGKADEKEIENYRNLLKKIEELK